MNQQIDPTKYYENTRLYSDQCFMNNQMEMNQQQSEYTVHKNWNNTSQPLNFGMYQSYSNFDKTNFNNETKLFLGDTGNQLTNQTKKQCKQLLIKTDAEKTSPLTDGHIMYYDFRILEDTKLKRSDNSYGNIPIDRFEPLIDNILENVQNPVHIIPTAWINGGMSTRNIIKNADYLKACGLGHHG